MSRLNILWTTDSEATITSLLVPYTNNALTKNWWDEVHVVIWGASTKYIFENKEIQDIVKNMIKNNIVVEACKFCADKFGATTLLEDLGVDVKYMGQPLTEYLKSDAKFLSI